MSDDPYVLARALIHRGERGAALQEAVRSLVKASRVEEAQTIFILARKTALADAGMDFDAVQAQNDFLAALKRWHHPESVARQRTTAAAVAIPAPVRDQPVARQAGRLRASFGSPEREARPRRPTVQPPGSLLPSPEARSFPSPQGGSLTPARRCDLSETHGNCNSVLCPHRAFFCWWLRRSPLELMALMTDANGVLRVPPPPREP